MTQLLMNSDGDVAIENNRLVLTENNSDVEISQRLIQNLKFFLQEWFLDRTQGVPYFQAVFVKGTPPDVVEAAFKEPIIETQGVASLERFAPLDLNSATRILKVDFDVKTINGTILNINEVLP